MAPGAPPGVRDAQLPGLSPARITGLGPVAVSVLVEVPGAPVRHLEHLLLDLNGTLALDGRLLDGVAERVRRLRASVRVWVVTADTFATLAEVQARLGLPDSDVVRAGSGADKVALLTRLGPPACAVIGNGANDVQVVRAAGLGLVVLGPEGAAADTLAAADIVCASVLDALDLLIHPSRISATLRR